MIIFIYTPSYDPNNGGAIALHRLCHLINSKTIHNAYIVPIGYPLKGWKKFRRCLKGELFKPRNFIINNKWNTPIWGKINFPSNAVAIYPEIVDKNPLGVQNVVRWLLHQPGYHNGAFNYGENELYFKFNSGIKHFEREGSKLSTNELKVIYYPIDIYQNKDNMERNIDSCHLIRKGTKKKFVHPFDSICIDGKSHKDIAEIFRCSKRFICYDDYTAYSIFAVLCGCQSIVIPAENVSLEDWYPNEKDRYGIAYGLSDEQLIWAEETKEKVFEHIMSEHKKSEENVELCIKEIIDYFKLQEGNDGISE